MYPAPAFNVIVCGEQTFGPGVVVMTGVGSGLTVIVYEAVALHIAASVTVTVYMVVMAGETVMDGVD